MSGLGHQRPSAGGNRAGGRVRVELPGHLRLLARVPGEVSLAIEGAVTLGAVLDALEAAYPMLDGTLRDYAQQSAGGKGARQRRAFIRFFACGQDLSHEPAGAALPERVAAGEEPLLIVGAIAGG